MLRSSFAFGASAIALAFAAPALAETTPQTAPRSIDRLVEVETAAQDGDGAETPEMSFGEWGFDPASLDRSIDPGDDFFAYANAKWLAANPLPPEFSRFGAFDLLREKSTSDVKALVDELLAKDARTADEQRIVDAYQAYSDTAAIDAAGLAPAKPYLDRIHAAETLDALVALWGTPGYPSPVGGYVSVDAKEPTRYSVYLGTGGLGLPDRDYYLDESEKGREIQAKYRDYIAFLLGEAGYEDARGAADAVYAFEENIARDIEWDRTVSRNADLTYAAQTPAQLAAIAGDYPLSTMIEVMGFGETDRFVVMNLPPSDDRAAELGLDAATRAKIGSGLPGMLALVGKVPLATLQAWTVKEFLENNASALPSRIDNADFAFYGQTLRGTPEQRPRWKRAIGETESLLGELIGASYVERYFPAESKQQMDELVANLRLALAQSLDEIEWMSPATKREAMTKLDSFDPKIGYRENLETYEGLTIEPGKPLANRMEATHWQWRDMLDKLGGPIDRTEWFMLPQTVNAYYNSTKNEIVFPAAILQQPFFGPSADPAVNYGAIGGVIGHEIGHGFDDQGSKSDSTGMLRNWWTDADRAAFDERGDALVEQYNAFCPLDDGETCVNGRLTLGENIGDLGGLSLAYRAYKIATEGQDVPVLDGLTGDQRFFLAWAQVWRSAQREDNARQRLRTDPHSPERFRVNGVVRNLDPWYEAFKVTPEDKLYLPPSERVSIW